MSTVYILKSSVTGKYYIGCTENFEKRIQQHNKGLVPSTKYFIPYRVMLTQEYKTINQARKIEYKLKAFKRKDFIDKIVKDGFIKRAHSSVG